MAALVNAPNEEDITIPVFTVTKNGTILKNIFILNHRHRLPPFSKATVEDYDDRFGQEIEENLKMGRHPNCNIVLNHPSISRFHLQINLRPSLQKLFVTDLSSVHGTWVSGRKIEPNVRVEVNAGDIIILGSSTRVYRLHWVPVSRACDLENPFLSEFDVAMIEEREEESADLEEENEVQMSQGAGNQGEASEVVLGMDTVSSESKDNRLLDTIWEGVVSMFSGECCYGTSEKKQTVSSPSASRKGDSSVNVEGSSSLRGDKPTVVVVGDWEVILDPKDQLSSKRKESSGNSEEQLIETLEEIKLLNLIKDTEKSENDTLLPESDSSFVNLVVPESGSGQVKELNLTLDVANEHPITQGGNAESSSNSSDSNDLENLKVESFDDQMATNLLDKDGKSSPSRDEKEQSETKCDSSLREGSKESKSSIILGTNIHQVEEENCSLQLVYLHPAYQEGSPQTNKASSDLNVLTNQNVGCFKNQIITTFVNKGETQSLPREGGEQTESRVYCYASQGTESVKSPFPVREGSLENIDNIESNTPQTGLSITENFDNIKGSEINSEKKMRVLVGERSGYTGNNIESKTPQHLLLATENLDNVKVCEINSEKKMSTPVQKLRSENICNGESKTSQSVLLTTENLDNVKVSEINSEKKRNTFDILSQRGRQASILHLQTNRSGRKTIEPQSDSAVSWEDRDDFKMLNRAISRALFSSPQAPEVELVTPPNKENYPPSTLHLKSSKSKSRLCEVQNSNSCRSSPVKSSGSLPIRLDIDITNASVEENKTPILRALLYNPQAPEIELSTPNKEDHTPYTLCLKSSKSKSRLREVWSTNSCRPVPAKSSGSLPNRLDIDIINASDESSPQAPEIELLTPNRENHTPNTLRSKSSKSKSRLQEVWNTNPCRSLPTKSSGSLPIRLDIDINTNSDKENKTLRALFSSPQAPNPIKENYTPNTLRLKSLKSKSRPCRYQKSNSCRSSPAKSSGKLPIRLDNNINNT